MMGTTWSIVLENVRRMFLQQFDIAGIGEEDGLLKVEICGVCDPDVG